MRVLADDSTAGYTIFAENMLETVADNSEECNIRYSKFPDADIEVSVSVRFTNSVSWRIAIKNLTDFCIEYIDFPLLSLKNNLKGSGKDAEIFWGFNEGIVVDDIARRENSWFSSDDPAYPCKGTQAVFPGVVEMPFMAYYGKDYGLYLAAHDNNGNMKGIDFFRHNEDICFRFRLFTGVDFGQNYESDFDIVMQPFMGDWQDAAEIYRTWFEKNKLLKCIIKIKIIILM